MYVCIYICTLLNVYCKRTVAFRSLCWFLPLLNKAVSQELKLVRSGAEED